MLSSAERDTQTGARGETRDFNQIAADFADGSVGRQLNLTPEALGLGLDIAYQAMTRGDVAQAAEIYASLLVCHPLHVEFNLGMANCALRMERADVALNCASVAIGRAKDDPRGYLLAAKALFALNQYEAAATDAREAIKLVEKSRLDDDMADFIEEEARRLLVASGAE